MSVDGDFPFESEADVFCGVVGVGFDFWAKGTSVWGVSESTTARMAEVNIKML